MNENNKVVENQVWDKSKITELKKEIKDKFSSILENNMVSFYYGYYNGIISTLYFNCGLIFISVWSELNNLIDNQRDIALDRIKKNG